MNKLTRFLTFAAISTASAMPTFALPVVSLQQQPAATTQQQPAATTQQAAPDNTQAKTDLYNKFREAIAKKDQAAAYELGKEYVSKYGTETDAIATYVKNFVAAYDKALPKFNCDKLITDKKWPEAFAACKQVAATDPEDLKTQINLSWAGLFASLAGNAQVMAEAPAYTQKAIQLINSGKAPDPQVAFANKDETLGWMHYALGYYNLKTNPKESANYLHKAAGFESPTKKDPQTYAWLALAYQTGEYNRLSQEYKTMYEGKPETPEGKAFLENIGQVLDRVIDAYARAIAYADTSAEPARYAAAKLQWMTDLTPLYKFRHNDSDAGLTEYIAGIVSKPLPSPTIIPVTPATMTPTSPTTTPATPGTTSPAGGATTPSGTTPTTTAPTGTAGSGTTVTPKPTPTKPTPSGTTTTAPTGTTPGSGTTTTPKPTPTKPAPAGSSSTRPQ